MSCFKYRSLYERLVANTYLAVEDNPASCWIWKGELTGSGYPKVTIRIPGVKNPRGVAAHRLMLEIVHDIYFPFDEAGHLCFETRCINPDHLEVQTKALNLVLRRGVTSSRKTLEDRMVPILYPRSDLYIPDFENLSVPPCLTADHVHHQQVEMNPQFQIHHG